MQQLQVIAYTYTYLLLTKDNKNNWLGSKLKPQWRGVHKTIECGVVNSLWLGVGWKRDSLCCLEHEEQYQLLSSLIVLVWSLHDTELIQRENTESPRGGKQVPLSSAICLPRGGGGKHWIWWHLRRKSCKSRSVNSKTVPYLQGESFKWLWRSRGRSCIWWVTQILLSSSQ